jgi:hypothetical protein
MSTWRYQRGDVPVGCLVGGVVAIIVVLVTIKVAPIMIHVGELDKEIGVLADRANRREYHDQRIRKDILVKAEQLATSGTKSTSTIDHSSTTDPRRQTQFPRPRSAPLRPDPPPG